MITDQEKEEIHEGLAQADQDEEKSTEEVLAKYKKWNIAGYHIDGTSISKDELRNQVKAASDRVKSGNYFSQKDIEKEVRNW